MTRRVTIQDVANLAGVSKVTVSYVLNGRDADNRISAETTARVLDAASSLGYRPNGVARMLATQRANAIAVVFQYASYFSHWSSFISEIMHGVCEAAVAHDFDLLLHTRASADPAEELGQLTDGRADGVLLLRDGNDPVVSGLLERQFPAVLFFTRSYVPGVAFVDADNYAGGRIATQHLLDLGHRRIAMVRGSLQSVSSNDRFNGYRDAVESAGYDLNPKHLLIAASPSDDLSGIETMMRQPDAPTAIFVWSDDVAYHVLKMLQRLGLSVPRDVSVIGFDSLSSSTLTSPPLTSVNQPITEMARDAAEMLIGMIQQQPAQRLQRVFPLSLDLRASTAPPRNHQLILHGNPLSTETPS